MELWRAAHRSSDLSPFLLAEEAGVTGENGRGFPECWTLSPTPGSPLCDKLFSPLADGSRLISVQGD